eukprot:s118_g12.t1
MYGLRGITNLYEGGTRSDYIVVAHPEFALGKVGSCRGFGAKWDLSRVPHELAGGPAAAPDYNDGASSHFRRTRMEDVQGRELGCDGRLTSGYFNNILEAGVASHRKEMQGSLLELARRYKREPEAVEHELLKSGSWRFWATELETVCGQRKRLATKQRDTLLGLIGPEGSESL